MTKRWSWAYATVLSPAAKAAGAHMAERGRVRFPRTKCQIAWLNDAAGYPRNVIAVLASDEEWETSVEVRDHDRVVTCAFADGDDVIIHAHGTAAVDSVSVPRGWTLVG